MYHACWWLLATNVGHIKQEAELLLHKALLCPLAAGSSQGGCACLLAIFISICARTVVMNSRHMCQDQQPHCWQGKSTRGPWSCPFFPVVGPHQLPGSAVIGESQVLPLCRRGEGLGREVGFGENGQE